MNYDSIAQNYVRTRQKHRGKLVRLARGILKDLGPLFDPQKPKIEVFEPGCGPGYFLSAFLSADNRVHAKGWDISAMMLTEATDGNQAPLRGFNGNGEARYDLRQCDLRDLQEPLPSADVAMSCFFLHLLENWQGALDRLLNIAGLKAYVHLFEDCDYYSAIAGSPLLLHESHPIAQFAKILNTHLFQADRTRLKGEYLPYKIIQYVTSEGSSFRLLSVRRVSWWSTYSFGRIVDDLTDHTMSPYYKDGEPRNVDSAIREIDNQLKGVKKLALKHDLWAFTFGKSAEPLRDEGKTTISLSRQARRMHDTSLIVIQHPTMC